MTLTSMNSFCMFLNFVPIESKRMYHFVSGFFDSASVCRIHLLLHAVEVHLCSVLFTIPWCEYSTIYLLTPDGHLGYFQLGVIMKSALWTYQHMPFVEQVQAFQLGVYPEGWSCWVMGTSMVNIPRRFQWLYQCTLPTAVGNCSSYSTFLSTLRFCPFFILAILYLYWLSFWLLLNLFNVFWSLLMWPPFF